MRALLRPIAATLLLVLLYFGYNLWLSASTFNSAEAFFVPASAMVQNDSALLLTKATLGRGVVPGGGCWPDWQPNRKATKKTRAPGPR